MEKRAFENISDGLSPEDEATARRLLPEVARERAVRNFPTRAGFSFFYELDGGWETRILMEDSEVRKVSTSTALEEAFTDESVKIIFIPKSSAVTRTVALRVCRRHGAGKTVFYEGKDNE
ncbi:MAG TPA: hypothetical protein VIG74_01970 [Alphaproteobacteria bacterium]|jgi:hypothetical protein